MPIRLNTLHNALVLVITEYCDTKIGTSIIVDESEVDLDERIASAMSTNEGDDIDRSSLLRYILHVINQLKPLVIESTILDDHAAMHLQQQLIQFVLDIQRALATSQSSSITVQYDEQDHVLFGFLRLMGLCKSGGIVQRELFNALNLPVTASKETLTEYFASAINAHQCPLLRAENMRLQEQKQTLRRAHSSRTLDLFKLNEEIEQLRVQLAKAAQPIAVVAKSDDIQAPRVGGVGLNLFGFPYRLNAFAPPNSTLTTDAESEPFYFDVNQYS